MMMSQEVNRLLGHALLDPALLNGIFSSDRAQVLQGYDLQPAEQYAILTSKAGSLAELSRELVSVCGTPDALAETDAAIDRFYQSLHAGTHRPALHSAISMEAVAQRIINTLPGLPAAAISYADIQAAS